MTEGWRMDLVGWLRRTMENREAEIHDLRQLLQRIESAEPAAAWEREASRGNGHAEAVPQPSEPEEEGALSSAAVGGPSLALAGQTKPASPAGKRNGHTVSLSPAQPKRKRLDREDLLLVLVSGGRQVGFPWERIDRVSLAADAPLPPGSSTHYSLATLLGLTPSREEAFAIQFSHDGGRAVLVCELVGDLLPAHEVGPEVDRVLWPAHLAGTAPPDWDVLAHPETGVDEPESEPESELESEPSTAGWVEPTASGDPEVVRAVARDEAPRDEWARNESARDEWARNESARDEWAGNEPARDEWAPVESDRDPVPAAEAGPVGSATAPASAAAPGPATAPASVAEPAASAAAPGSVVPIASATAPGPAAPIASAGDADRAIEPAGGHDRGVPREVSGRTGPAGAATALRPEPSAEREWVVNVSGEEPKPVPMNALVAVRYLPARIAVCRALRQMGWTVEEVADLDRAAERLVARRYGAVFMDVSQPLPLELRRTVERDELADLRWIAIGSRLRTVTEVPPRPLVDAPRLFFPFGEEEARNLIGSLSRLPLQKS